MRLLPEKVVGKLPDVEDVRLVFVEQQIRVLPPPAQLQAALHKGRGLGENIDVCIDRFPEEMS